MLHGVTNVSVSVVFSLVCSFTEFPRGRHSYPQALKVPMQFQWKIDSFIYAITINFDQLVFVINVNKQKRDLGLFEVTITT